MKEGGRGRGREREGEGEGEGEGEREREREREREGGERGRERGRERVNVTFWPSILFCSTCEDMSYTRLALGTPDSTWYGQTHQCYTFLLQSFYTHTHTHTLWC